MESSDLFPYFEGAPMVISPPTTRNRGSQTTKVLDDFIESLGPVPVDIPEIELHELDELAESAALATEEAYESDLRFIMDNFAREIRIVFGDDNRPRVVHTTKKMPRIRL